jgi:hypothetical protein
MGQNETIVLFFSDFISKHVSPKNKTIVSLCPMFDSSPLLSTKKYSFSVGLFGNNYPESLSWIDLRKNTN